MSVKEILENAMHLVIDLTVNKKIISEEADLFSTFVGMFQYAILTDKKTNNDEPMTLIVVTDDINAKKRMFEFAKSLLIASKLTRMVSNDLIWTNDIHIHFCKSAKPAIGIRFDHALIDISTENGREAYMSIFPVVASNPNGKCVAVKKAL